MNLQVQIVEARDLPARDSNGLSDPYVHLQLGSTKYRTSVVYKTLNPKWNEKFVFKVENLQEELVLTLWDEDRFVDDFLGQLKLPVQRILEADKQKLPASWYTLQKRHPFSRAPVSGEVLVGMSLSGKYYPPVSPIESEEISEASSAGSCINMNTRSIDNKFLTAKESSHSMPVSGQGDPKENVNTSYEALMKKITDLFVKVPEGSPQVDDACVVSSEERSQTGTAIAVNGIEGETLIESFFNDSDMIPLTISMDSLPPPLSGGILLDCSYAASVKALNAVMFKPGCQFYRDFLSLQRATDTVEGPWKQSEDGCLQRIVTYRRAATKLVKMVNATEEQTYIMADKTGFAVMRRVSTPDVPFGSTFKIELLFTMIPLLDLPNGDVGTRLTISWRINFLRSTPMKSVIENGARKGLKDTYRHFAELLPKFVDPIDDTGVAAIYDQEEVQLPELPKPKSGREMALEYFGNLTVVSTFLMLGFLFLHVILTKPNGRVGLEFWGLDMADSVGEILTTAIVVLQVERLVKMTHHLLHTRYQQGSDHGGKQIEDEWLLSVTLVEGMCLAPADSSKSSDPYVVFTCGGKTRNSSVKFQTSNPQWQEYFEFGVIGDPPSVMKVEAFNFEGLFTEEAASLGSTEIEFLNYSSEELADLWLLLEGNIAQSSGSRLHLQVFLTNSRTVHDTIGG